VISGGVFLLPNADDRSAGGTAKMDVSEIERATTMADMACSVVIERPADIDARERLFEVLAAIANPRFADGEDKRPAVLQGLLHQACVLAEIARRKIEDSRNARSRADFLILNATLELRRVLSQILGHVASGGDA
jgi:hypothetical protein